MSLTPDAAGTLRRVPATAVVVPVTPHQADGNPDWDTYATLTSRLIDNGASVITPNGFEEPRLADGSATIPQDGDLK